MYAPLVSCLGRDKQRTHSEGKHILLERTHSSIYTWSHILHPTLLAPLVSCLGRDEHFQHGVEALNARVEQVDASGHVPAATNSKKSAPKHISFYQTHYLSSTFENVWQLECTNCSCRHKFTQVTVCTKQTPYSHHLLIFENLCSSNNVPARGRGVEGAGHHDERRLWVVQVAPEHRG